LQRELPLVQLNPEDPNTLAKLKGRRIDFGGWQVAYK
jgi:hypothetical protein